MLELIELSPPYRDSFLTGLRDLQADGRLLHYDLASISADFEAFVQRLHEKKDRAKIAAHRVPGVDYWLYENHAILLGHLSLRYELNASLLQVGGYIGYRICPAYRRQGYGKAILRLGLEKARASGLRRVLVTCDETNIGSKTIIEANGGQLENSILLEGDPIRKLWYWIDLP
ncbi:MAG TPA: GNAT family N-acetyltransferase [Ktedonobacteraceae bacterium]|jgi:predicted acetyltransferase|nr:GNAT family N-acetyltransferase [Ktedonobacteraceae bacterium]